jgi:hypothetical protein
MKSAGKSVCGTVWTPTPKHFEVGQPRPVSRSEEGEERIL